MRKAKGGYYSESSLSGCQEASGNGHAFLANSGGCPSIVDMSSSCESQPKPRLA